MISTEARAVSAYLYFHLGDRIPDPILDERGEIDVEADNALIEEWSEGSDPTRIDMARVQRFLDDLNDLLYDLPHVSAENYMPLFYEAAKKTFDHDKSQIRTWFRWLYLIVFQVPEGPRWGDFVEIYGAQEFVTKVRSRLFDITAKEMYR